MKLFGDSPKKSKKESKERIPAPKDKSRRKKTTPAGEEIQEEYLEENSEEYDDYDQSEYDENADDSYEAEEYDGEYDEYEDDEYEDDDEYDDDEYEDDDEYDDDDEYEDDDDEDDNRRMSLRKKILIGVIIFLVLLLGGVGLFINYLLDLINYQAANSDYFATVSTAEELPEETAENSYLEQLDEEDKKDELEATASELEQWNDHIENVTSDSSSYTIPISDDVYNILLIGSDTRASGEVGRSDAMILVSINQKTETIYLTSFLRDCYVNIPGYGNTRLNHAFAYGGPDLLEQTLEQNFKVHVASVR